ncbi:MAG TPA: single-stranded-DNA-specific exonuclease RecJ [Candidatus Saccharimonadia bacterium]|nr:single-stranded-DNA-specific exonuclease RecJ [Candidatus Saccharimonadia bacterium]
MSLNLLSKTVPQTADELIDVLLKNRGIEGKKAREEFLNPTFPMEFTPESVGIDPVQMKHAIELLTAAKEKGSRVLVFGDYDADGVCSTAVMWETLNAFGCKVLPFIPDRTKHGYGLSANALDEILADTAMKPELIISVDNGIVAIDSVKRLKKEGVQVIITDHHLPEASGFPPADAVVHTTQLCGATVAWMVAHEILPEHAAKLLDLCGIATIADMVPLKGPNRSFAKFGVEALKTTTRPGLKVLFQVAGIDQKNIAIREINYGIAPRINAMARLGDAKDALRLLCSKNAKRIEELATKVHVTNTDRQDLTGQLIELAKLKEKEWADENIIVIDDAAFHDGVIGLVAGKLVEDYWKPAIVISRHDGISKGSARSIPGVNIIELIRKAREELLDVGGHPMAAGFSVETAKIDAAKKKLRELAREIVTPKLLVRTTDVDCVLPWSLVNEETVQVLKVLEPHGMANPIPTFLLENMMVIQASAMGRDQEHLKLVLHHTEAKPGELLEAVGFGMRGKWKENTATVQLVGQLQINVWKTRRTMQVIIRGM